MYASDDDFPDNAVRPVHPQWFSLDIPLLESPIFSQVTAVLIAEHRENEGCHYFKVNFFNQFTTKVSASLKTQIDLVSTAQTRLLASCGSLLMAILNGSLYLSMKSFEARVLGAGA